MHLASDLLGIEITAPPPEPAQRSTALRTAILLTAMFLVSLAMRWTVLTQWLNSDLHYIKPDTGHYISMAYQAADGDFRFSVLKGHAERTTLLSIVLAPLFVLFGPGLMSAKLLNAALGAAIVFPMYGAGKVLFGRRAGLWAAVMTVVVHFYFRYAVVLYAESLYTLLYLTAIWLLIRTIKGQSSAWVLGLVVGLSYLTRTTGLILAGAMGAILLLSMLTEQSKVRWRSLGAYVLLFLLTAAPMGIVKVYHGHAPWAHGTNNHSLWAEDEPMRRNQKELCTPGEWLNRHPDVLGAGYRRLHQGAMDSLAGRIPHEYGYVIQMLGIAGMLWAVVRRRSGWVLLLFWLQAPLYFWAMVGNPAERLVWGPLGPLFTLWAGWVLAEIWDGAMRRSVEAPVLATGLWALLLGSGSHEFLIGPHGWAATGALAVLWFAAKPASRGDRIILMLRPVMAVGLAAVFLWVVWPYAATQMEPLWPSWVTAAGLIAVGLASLVVAGGLMLDETRERLLKWRVVPLAAAAFILAVCLALGFESLRFTGYKVDQYRQRIQDDVYRVDQKVHNHPDYSGPPGTDGS